MDDSQEKIEDSAELAQVRNQARRVNMKSFVAAAALTLVGFIILFIV